MQVLLVSPRTPNTFWSFCHVLPLMGRKAAFPPLGLLTVAAMLPRDWSLKVVDLNARRLSDADLRAADVVMISAMLVHEPSVREVLRRAMALGKPVIGGGPLFTTGAERFPDMTSCVIGEVEDVMPEIVRDLERRALKPRYQAAERPDITATPIPRWDLINVHDYVTLSVQTSRGCPFDCEFCDITPVYGRVPRVKDPEQVVAELEAIRSTGWRGGVFVVDDNFIGHRPRTKAILRAIIAWRERTRAAFSFTTEASLNLADDPELIELMVRAGFRNVFVGIESPQEESLRECNKVQNTRRDLAAAVRTIHQAGMQVMGGFIVGFDSDTRTIFERQRRFIQEAGVVTAMVGLLTALPGTRLMTRLSHEGRLLKTSTGNNLDAVLNFVPALEPEVLIEGYRSLVKELYAPRAYYQRVATFLKSYRPPSIARPWRARWPEWADVRAFLLSLWIMGVVQPGRLEYWKFLLRTAIWHRRAFAEAIELAIRGYHFRAVAASL